MIVFNHETEGIKRITCHQQIFSLTLCILATFFALASTIHTGFFANLFLLSFCFAYEFGNVL